jgi:SWI/SNF-related matrix-associated actin-dependent regulator 1 of chromatin subfamily A
MLNRPIELFSLLNLINPVEWCDWFKYAIRYCDGKKTYFGWDMTGASNLAELKTRLENYMIRRTKKEVLDQLPELTRTRMPVDVKRAEIKAAMESLQTWVEENGTAGQNRAEAMVRVGKLRQAIGLAKVPIVIEMVEDMLEADETKKVVIYAVHHSVVHALEEGLKKWSVSSITGEVPQKDRQLRIDNFQNRAKPRVMIISSAGGEGIDLFKSSVVIFSERDWVPGIEEQVEARCHRMGQKNAVEAIYPIAQGTIDVEMDQLIESKRDVFRELIGLDNVKTTSMVFDEIIKLIQKGGK